MLNIVNEISVLVKLVVIKTDYVLILLIANNSLIKMFMENIRSESILKLPNTCMICQNIDNCHKW